jgi:hypothetical protein
VQYYDQEKHKHKQEKQEAHDKQDCVKTSNDSTYYSKKRTLNETSVVTWLDEEKENRVMNPSHVSPLQVNEILGRRSMFHHKNNSTLPLKNNVVCHHQQ